MRARLHPGTEAMVSQACLVSSHHRQERFGPLFGSRAETVFSETMPRPQLELGLPLASILLYLTLKHTSVPQQTDWTPLSVLLLSMATLQTWLVSLLGTVAWPSLLRL